MDEQEMRKTRDMLLDFSIYLINERFRDKAPFIALSEIFSLIDKFTKKNMRFCLCDICKGNQNNTCEKISGVLDVEI
jgi:hypothetical protein